MALDQKDILAIAKSVADLLAPQVREVASELIAVRVEAATQSLHESHEATLTQLQAISDRLQEEHTARETAQAKSAEDLSSTVGTVRTYFTELLAASKQTFEDQLTTLRAAVGGMVDKATFVDVEKDLRGAVSKVAESIPTVPPPLALVEGGELTPVMQEVMGIATKQLFTPLLDARGQQFEQGLVRVSETLVRTAESIKHGAEQDALVIAGVLAKVEEVRERTVDIEAMKESQAVLLKTQTMLAEAHEQLPVKLAAQAQHILEQSIEGASAVAREAAVDLVNKGAVELKAQFEEMRNEVRTTVTEAVNTVPTLVEGQVGNVAERLLPQVREAASDAALKVAEGSAQDTVERNEAFRTQLQETVQNVAQATAHEHMQRSFVSLTEKVRDAVVEKAIPDLLAQGKDAGQTAADTFLAGRLAELKQIAAAAGSEAGTAAGLHAASSAVPAARDAAVEVIKEYVPTLTDAAEKTALATTTAHLTKALDGFLTQAHDAGMNAGLETVAKALPELRVEALELVKEQIPGILAKASAESAARAADVFAANQDSFLEGARSAGAEAGMSAAVKAVPDVVHSMKAGIEEEILPRATAAANTEATRVTNSRWDEVKEAATTVAVAKALHTVAADLPGLVAAQADAVGALVQPGAIAAATATAKTLGEQAVTLAREQAAVAATQAATAATGALRDQLLKDLDPTQRVDEAVETKVQIVSRELGDAIGDAVATHMSEELPRLHVLMMSKIQAEVDRIPRPEDGEPGKDGRDARVEVPVPYIEGKMYEYGTWVNHEGSLWVAARHSDLPPSPDNRDWYCVVPGIKNVTATLQKDQRTLNIVTELGSGTLVTNSVRLDIPISKGLYNDKHEYQKRDIATYDGSWWEALKDGTLPPPGLDRESWKLHIKRGANAPAPKVNGVAVAKPVFKGDWGLDMLCQPGDQVDHAGYRWMALKATRERPPFSLLKSNDTWTMMGPAV